MNDSMDSPERENARTYRSTPTTEMVTDNTLTSITKWKYVWKSGSGINNSCDFTVLKAYATDDHIRLLISKFQQSGWRESTKVAQFFNVRSVLAHVFNKQSSERQAKVEFSPETCAQFIHMSYLSIVSTGKGLNGKPIKAKTLGWLSSNLNSICKKFGFGIIPKAARNLDTRSATLDSDNYTAKELRAIAFVLLEDRKKLLSRYLDNTLINKPQRRLLFDRLVCNAVFLTIYYLGTGLTETLSMFLEDSWGYQQSGTGRISIEGFKTRGEKVELRTFTPRASCKSFFESHLKLSKMHSVNLGLDKHYLFRKMNGKAPTGGNLHDYVNKYLFENSTRFQSLIESNPKFRLNSNLLKSSIKQLAEQRMGRAKAADNTRNATSTYDSSNYGRVSMGEARSQLAVGLTALHYLGENPSGGSILAVVKAKATVGQVLSNEEWEKLKAGDGTNQVVENLNGGFCKGENTPEKQAFQKAIYRAGVLSDNDRPEHQGGIALC